MSAVAGLAARVSALPLPAGLRRRLAHVSADSGVYLGHAGTAFLIRTFGAAIGFALQVLLARLLSLTDYGLYVTFWTWLFLAGQIAALGFNDSCLRFLPRYLARGRLEEARAFLRTGFAMVVAGSLAIAAAGLTGLWAMSFLLPAGDPRWLLLILFFAGIPFMAVELYLDGIARSFGLFVLSAAPAFIVRPVLLALAVIAVALLGLHLSAVTALALAIAVTGVVTIGQAVMIRRRITRQIGPDLSISERPRKQRRLWLAATLPLTLVYGIEEIYLVSDILLLGLFAEPAEVGIYFAAVRLMTLAGYVYYAFMLISSREFSLARAGRDHADLQGRVSRATSWTFWLTVPTVAGIVALGYPLLSMFGPDYVAGYGVLAVLGLGLIARASVGQAGDLLVVLGHQKANLWVALASLVLNALVTLALLPWLGILAAAIGTAVSQAARAAALAYYARRLASLDTFVFAGGLLGRHAGPAHSA
ncbi:oligosaccharide flippase family protein [Afifella pfennigii]|uniref:oligosaccharide flippase family protein n=1 Tax=Afifella pfennigii TaxID=209897 RepID=UPI00047DE44D|nr:oligosaccharide flippase family protein [Afifella pfennigii]